MTLLDQLPTLSKWDPGVTGEGSLDPLGMGSVADRLADHLAPGVRARMQRPHFVVLIAISAVVGQEFSRMRSADGTTRADVVFEWLVLEALARHQRDALQRYPGSTKAVRALAGGKRLSPATYLRGPRVFGFSGVYRPYCVDIGVIDAHGEPGDLARDLVAAWEQENGLDGFLHNDPATSGGQLRRWIADAIGKSMLAGESCLPRSTAQAREFAELIRTVGDGRNVRRLLRASLFETPHPLRKEVVQLIDRIPVEADDGSAVVLTDRAVADAVRPHSGAELGRLLEAVTRFEQLAVTLDNCFRFALGRFRQITSVELASDQVLLNGAAVIRDRADRALSAVADVDLIGTDLSVRVAELVAPVREASGPAEFFDGLVRRHLDVQQAKGKTPWLTDDSDGWVPRILYRDQPAPRDQDEWMHPYRLTTLYSFVEGTR